MNKIMATKVEKRICDKCGYENEQNAIECSKCHSKRFAPPWIIAKRPIDRWTSVDITKSNPEYGTSVERITLNKWWPGPGHRSAFNIPNAMQWDAIQRIINSELYLLVGWETEEQHLKNLQRSVETKTNVEQTLKALVNQYPDLFLKIIDVLDPTKLAKIDINSLLNTFSLIADAMSKGSASLREAFLEVLEKLPEQRPQAIRQLDSLLQEWNLQQITSVAQTVRTRIDTLQLFKKQIRDERTYELKGDNSIHRILENAMWMIDERYWLLKSNSTLRSFIGEEMSKKDKRKFGKKRPDFVCGSVGQKLIIVEIKRPSKALDIEDVNQTEDYLTIAEKYSSEYRSFEAYLIGNKKADDLSSRLKYRSSAFNIMTYTDLIDRTEQRYQEHISNVG